MPIWTVDREVDQPISHVNQNASGGSFVAKFTLRLSPDLDNPSVRFIRDLQESVGSLEELDWWVPYIEKGVQGFLDRRSEEGKPLGYLRVTLTNLYLHPTDSVGYKFERAACTAMEIALETYGITLD